MNALLEGFEPLVREVGCLRAIHWRGSLPKLFGEEQVRRALVCLAFEDRGTTPAVWVYENEDGDVFVLVPQTRRLQVRVSYLEPYEGREARARALWRDFASALMAGDRSAGLEQRSFST